MARIYIGEKLIRKVIFFEPEDLKKIEEISKQKNQTIGQYFRFLTSRVVKYEEDKIKIKAKPVLE